MRYYEIGGLPFGTKISKTVKTWYRTEVKCPTWKALAGEGKGRKMEREKTEGDWDERKLSRAFLLLATPPVCACLAGLNLALVSFNSWWPKLPFLALTYVLPRVEKSALLNTGYVIVHMS